MKWEKVKLGEVCVSISDGDHQAPPKVDIGIPFVTISNIINNKLDFTNTMYVPKEYYEALDDKRKPHVGDIIYSVVGSFGIPVFIQKDKEFVFQRHIAILRPDKYRIVPQFLYYVMLSREFFMQADAVALGAAQRTISLTALRNMMLDLPPRDTQNKIASILSAYDDLIENNQKQIKLLEEAAQRLYKEWFVDLRFPGHENVKIVDGVPEGWKRTIIGDFLRVRSGYAFKSAWWQNDGYPVVKIKDIVNSTIDMSNIDYVAPEYTKKALEFKLNRGDIVIAMTGATIGKIAIVPEMENLYTNQRVGKVFVNKALKSPEPYIFCFYKQNEILEKIYAVSSSSSAQPNISGKQLESFQVVTNIEMIELFGEYTKSLYDNITNLYGVIDKLKEARDRLLPKLMSGEIEV
ncbi:MAG: restriction endonuclease subunit S [Phascolarctobacterium sp.]|nr:restriction endonuclease subunit S [Phascolarctobacterium sp.]